MNLRFLRPTFGFKNDFLFWHLSPKSQLPDPSLFLETVSETPPPPQPSSIAHRLHSVSSLRSSKHVSIVSSELPRESCLHPRHFTLMIKYSIVTLFPFPVEINVFEMCFSLNSFDSCREYSRNPGLEQNILTVQRKGTFSYSTSPLLALCQYPT